MSMSVLNPRLQVVKWLPNSPKMKVKGVLLVRGPWDETSSSLRLPFDINRSQSFPGVWSGQSWSNGPFPGYLVCYDELTLGCSCKEGLARQAGELGGEVEL